MDPFDVPTLLSQRGALERLDPAGPPAMVPVTPLADAPAVALLSGSFNPPTAGHLMLAERARGEGYDLVVFVLPRHAAGKEQTGLAAEDRLGALRACDPGLPVAVASHALYAEQAEAARALFPGAELCFLVGSDKVVQIFDDRWYEDRDEALDRLFSRVRIMCAPRSDDADEVRAVLEDRRNARWADQVGVLRLHPAVGDLSSTHVRGLLRAGADPTGLVPLAVASYLADVHAFAPPLVVGKEEVDAYAVRARLLDLLWRLDGGIAASIDLRALTERACSPTEDGTRLREALRAPDDDAADAVRVHAGAPI